MRVAEIQNWLLVAGMVGSVTFTGQTRAAQGGGVPQTKGRPTARAGVLTVEDVEKTSGLKGIKLDRQRLGNDSVIVFTKPERLAGSLATCDALIVTFLPASLDWQKFVANLGALSPMTGTGDEAYRDPSGQVICFRKGKAFVMLQSLLSPTDQKPFLSPEQLQKLASIAASRL